MMRWFDSVVLLLSFTLSASLLTSSANEIKTEPFKSPNQGSDCYATLMNLVNEFDKCLQPIDEVVEVLLTQLPKPSLDTLQPECSLCCRRYFQELQSPECVLSNAELRKLVMVSPMYARSMEQLCEVNLRRVVGELTRTLQFQKVLLAYSAFSGFTIDLDTLSSWAQDENIFWTWYIASFQKPWTHFDEAHRLSARKLLEYAVDHAHLPLGLSPSPPMFAVSYMHPEIERAVKAQWNKQLYGRVGAAAPHCDMESPPRDRVLIIAGSWTGTESVYRNFVHIVESLSYTFSLDLGTETPSHMVDSRSRHLFQLITSFQLKAAGGDIVLYAEHPSVFCTGRYKAALFLDVGMRHFTTAMSHLRVAPVQLATYGHSVSTFGGSKIDYWIGGRDVELAANSLENYSEELVLVSGLGISHMATPKTSSITAVDRVSRVAPSATSVRVINLPWTSPKITVESLRVLGQIAKMSKVPISFRFFTAVSEHIRSYKHALGNALINNGVTSFEIVEELEQHSYGLAMSYGFMMLDNIPFGGCNTVFDSVVANIPVVMLEGRVWHNRIGPATVRKLLPKASALLIADTEAKYVSMALDLLHQPDIYASVVEEMSGISESDLQTVGADTVRDYVPTIQRLLGMKGNHS